jgi:hypothetical protein
MREKVPWGRVLVEGAVVVISILLAFGIDATWDNRSAANAEQALLTSLRDEFAQNRTIIEGSIQFHEVDASVAAFLLRARPDVGRDSLATAVAMSTYFRTTDPHVGAISSAIAGGGLERVNNEELRALVASWPGDFNDVGENEALEWSLVHEQQLRLIGEYVDVASLAAFTDTWPSPIEDPDAPSEGALRRLVSDARFRTVLFQRLINDRLMLGEFETLLERVNEVLSLLDAEIES